MYELNDLIIQMSFSIYSNPGVYAVLLGSGISRSAGILTGYEITLDLASKLSTMIEKKEVKDVSKWYKDYFKEDINYSKIITKLAKTRSERSNLLKSYFEPIEKEKEEGKKIPTKAHRSIAKLVKYGYLRMILSLNFDRLMEEALAVEGINPHVISSVDSIKGTPPPIHSNCILFKIHGDYLDSRIRNTVKELEKYPKEYNVYLDRVFDEYGLIICGWSSDYDIALRNALQRIKNRRYSAYWAVKDNLSQSGKELLNFIQATEVPINNADHFFSNILDNIESLEKFKKPHPLTSKIAVESVKRFLSKNEYIKCHDLVKEETERVHKLITSEKFNVGIRCEKEVYQNRMHDYESAMNILIPIMNTIAYFGNGKYLKFIVNTIERLLPEMNYGNSVGLHFLQLYPALLLEYSIGIIALYAKNFEALTNLILKPSYIKEDERKSTIESLNINYVFQGPYSEFVPYKEDEGRYTRGSDYLFELFQKIFKDDIPEKQKYEENFDIFEYLIGLIYLDKRNPGSEIENTGFPIGRFSWKYFGWGANKEKGRVIFGQFFKNYLEKLLAKGFFNGSEERFNKFRQLYEDTISKMHR
jgi:hypothetical protein